jgi:hypothetical protein
MVDSRSREEPPTRRFATLKGALKSVERIDRKWYPFLWLYEEQEQGKPAIQHIREGKACTAEAKLWVIERQMRNL